MKLRLIYILFSLGLILGDFSAFAQFKEATLGVEGLTCSQCTRSVEMSLRRLDFIQDVDMDLENTRAKISFKPKMQIDFFAIAKAVKNAGFSLGYVEALYLPEQEISQDQASLKAGNFIYYTLDQQRFSNNPMHFLLLGKNMLSAKAKTRFEVSNQLMQASKDSKGKRVPVFILKD